MKSLRSVTPLFVLVSALAARSLLAADVPAKVTYNDHILPIFKNACLNCHNPDKKKAGLDLSTYAASLAGSDNGKVMESGNPSASLLVKCVRQTEDPKMPPKGDKLTDAEIAIIEKWVSGQLLESMTGKAVTANNNVQVAVVSLSKPDGPPPMPTADLPLEPFVRTKSTNALIALAASPWAPLVAVGGQKQIILYNTETLQPLGILPFPEGFPAIIRFSKNGKLLMTGGGLGGKSGKVVLWDVQTGERAGEVGNEFDQVLGADLSPDQQHVALGGPGKLLKIYSTKDGKLEHSIKKHTDWITAVAFSPDGKYLASADRNGGILVWEGATGHEFNSLPGHKACVTALSFMPGVLASASEDGKIALWDVKEGKEIRNWAAHPGGASSVDFTPDGRLVSAGRDKLAKAWDQTGKVLLTSAPFEDIALRAVLASDRVVAGDWNGSIRVFDLKAGPKAVGELSSNPPPITDNLAAAEKQLADVKAEQVKTEQALATAEKVLKDALAAAQQKNKETIAAAEKDAKQAQTELDALKSTTATDADAKAKLPAAEKKQQETAAALAAAQKVEVKLALSPDLQAKAEAAKKNVEALRAELPGLEAARKNNPSPKADARIATKQAEIATAQTAFDAARQAADLPPQESEVARLKTERDQLKPRIDLANASVQRWQRAQAFMRVHTSKQAIAELQAKYEELVATAKDALSPIAKSEADLADAEKTIKESPAVIAAKQAAADTARAAWEKAIKAVEEAQAVVAEKETKKKAAAELETTLTADLPNHTKRQLTAVAAEQRKGKSLEGLTKDTPEYNDAVAKIAARAKETADSQAALDAANKALADAKQQQEALAPEITKAKEALTTAALDAKKATTAKIAAESALTSAKKAKESAELLIATLKPKTGEIAAEAKKAKEQAEKDAAETANKLAAAKAEATRIKTEYDAKYPAPSASQPIAAK
jgi:WD40 repeat protein/mono/diheme cytochrome c family protein